MTDAEKGLEECKQFEKKLDKAKCTVLVRYAGYALLLGASLAGLLKNSHSLGVLETTKGTSEVITKNYEKWVEREKEEK